MATEPTILHSDLNCFYASVEMMLDPRLRGKAVAVWPLPASDLLYVGRATAKRLEGYGIHTIGDIARTPTELLHSWFGVNGLAIWKYASGTDTSRVMHKDFVSPVKSIGHGITCTADLEDEEEVWKGGTAELNTALGILANNGIKGAEGGTHLRNVILALQSPTDKAAACMESLGVEVYDSEGNMRSLNDILGDLNTSMDGMTSAEKQNIISGADIYNGQQSILWVNVRAAFYEDINGDLAMQR